MGAPGECAFGQPRLPKPLQHHHRVCLVAPGDPSRYCEVGIDLKQTRRRLASLSVTSEMGLVSRASPVHTAMRNCTRDEGGPFGFGDQVLIPSHREPLRSKAVVVSVAETPG